MDPATLRPIGEITTQNGFHADNGGSGTLNVPTDGSKVTIHRVAFIYVDHSGVNHQNLTARAQNIEILKNRIRRADLNRLSKDRVMKCFGFIFDRSPFYYVVDLAQFRQWKPLHKVAEGRSIAQKLDLLRKAAETVSYLHSLDPRIVHGDLQPLAFVVSPDCGDVILRDFGLGHALRYLTADDLATTMGTSTALGPWRAGYSSPQCIELLGEPNREGELEPSDDVFAFAGVILKVLSGDGPHEGPLPPGPKKQHLQYTRMASLYSGRPPERNEHSNLPADDSLWDLLDTMWQKEREDRPSFADVIQKLKDESERRGSVVQPPLPSVSLSAVPLTAIASPQDSAADYTIAPPIPDDHLSISQVSTVWSGRYSDVTQGSFNLRPEDDFWVPVAIKRLKCFYTSPSSQEETFNRLKRESTIWLGLRNKYILEYYGYQTTPEPRLVSPWCAQGNLKNLILNPNSVPVTLKRCIDLLLDVCKGVKYLHTRSPVAIVHGDIKPENVIIADDGHAMLCDFGLARLHRGHTGLTDGVGPTGTGTAGYIAPEVVEEWTQQKPADIWALGSTFLTCLSKKEPWDHIAKSLRWKVAVEQKIPSRESHPELPANNGLWELMERCWKFEPAARPTIQEVLDHVVLTSNSPNSPIKATVTIKLAIEAPQEISRECVRYNIEDCLGRGYFAEVYKGTLYTSEGGFQDVAIKVLNECDMTSSTTENDRTERLRKRVDRESGTWGAMNHYNILPVLGVCYGSKPDSKPYIITPYCKNGDLDKFLQGHSKIPASHRLRLLLGAARGLEHLHTSRPPICHGDVKLSNILVDDNGTDVFLCDFGLAMGFEAIDTANGTSGVPTGTVRFASPEQLHEATRTICGDVFSFGCLILNTMTGSIPWSYKAKDTQVNILRIKQPDAIPDASSYYKELPECDSLWDLMARCWSFKPENRPSMTEVVQVLAEKLRETSAEEASNDQ